MSLKIKNGNSRKKGSICCVMTRGTDVISRSVIDKQNTNLPLYLFRGPYGFEYIDLVCKKFFIYEWQ